MRMMSALTALAVFLLPAAALAADAAHPYSNVNRRVDAGNNTGDAQVDGLNQAQLGGTGYQPRTTSGPAAGKRAQANPYYPYAPPVGPAVQPRSVPTSYAAPAYLVRPYYPPVYVAAPPLFYPAPFFYPRPFFFPY